MTKIFENITILELSDSAGEYTGKLFAGMGAHVIKVEPPTQEPWPYPINGPPENEYIGVAPLFL